MRRCGLLLVAAILPLPGGSIEGRVTNSVTQAGIAGVAVEVQRIGVSQQAVTDESGMFRIANLPDGDYRFTYEKDGFDVPRTDRPRPLVRVEGDAHVDATLTPFASVHGRVTDPEGKPAAGVTVQMTPVYDSTTVTDAEGNFGFSKLRPGSYTLAAKPKEAPSKNGERLVTTYFPSDVDLEDAEPIVVAGVDLFGYEIRLKAAAVHALHGVVTGADGKPVAHAVVNLLKPGSGPVTWVRGNYNTIAFHRLPTQSQQVEAGEDGSFEFAEVLDGAWRVQAQTAAEYDYQRHTDLVRGSGGVDLNVSGREPEPVEIRLTPAFSLDVVEEWGDQAPSHPRAMFNVLPMDDLLSNPDQADFEKTHRIEGLLAGRHLFEPGQFPTPGYYLSAAQLNGQDVLGQAAELLGPGTLRLVFRGDGGSVRGTVTKGSGDKAAGALVLLMTQRADGSRVGYSASSGADGGFAIGDVPPGDYTILALQQAPADVMGPEFDSELAAGERLRVEAGAAAAIDLRLR